VRGKPIKLENFVINKINSKLNKAKHIYDEPTAGHAYDEPTAGHAYDEPTAGHEY